MLIDTESKYFFKVEPDGPLHTACVIERVLSV